jgi:hypothetical protein
MKSSHFLLGIALLTAFAGTGVAPASASSSNSWIHGGAYTSKARPGEPGIKFTVFSNGRLLGLGQGTSYGLYPVIGSILCIPSPALIAQEPTLFSSNKLTNIGVDTLKITPSGTFSFSGGAMVGISTFITVPITLRGHFVRGTIVPGKTVAAIVTLTAPQVCVAGTPRTFHLVWR